MSPTNRSESLDATAISAAHDALTRRATDPKSAASAAKALVAARSTPPDARAVALRTMALVEFDSGDRLTARRFAVRAVHWARRSGDLAVLGGCLTTLAGVEFFAGSHQRTVAAITEAAAVAPNSDVRYTRAWMLYRASEWNAAVAAYEELLSDELTAEDRALALSHYALVLAELGRNIDAVRVANEARVTWADGSLTSHLTLSYNLAYCLALAGRIPEALSAFDQLALDAAQEPGELAWVAEGHAGVLARCNLLDDARAACDLGLAAVGSRGPLELRSELWWRRAQIAAAMDDRATAAKAASTAQRLYTRLGNPGRADLARSVLLRVRPTRRPQALAELATLAESFAAQHRWEPAVEAAAHVATELAVRGSSAGESVRALLDDGRSNVTALGRAHAWIGLAADAHASASSSGVARACRHGFAALDDVRRQFGSAEMRVRTATLSERLLDLGLVDALRDGDAAAVLDLTERARARALLLTPVAGPDVAAALAHLHRLRTDPDTPHDDLLDAESRVRRAALRAGPGHDVALRALDRHELADALDDRTLISFIVHRGVILRVTSRARDMRLARCASLQDVSAVQRDLRFAVQRLARSNLSSSIAASMTASATRNLNALREALFSDGGDLLAGPSLIVPPPMLADVPFHAFGSGDTLLAPSATWWARAAAQRSAPRRSVVAAHGPDLAMSEVEAREVAACYPRAVMCSSVTAFTNAFAEADVAHVAAHGRLRADHPHLSSMQLGDGTCTLYDLDVTGRVPETVVLAACEAAGGSAHPGDEVLGFVSELIGLGARNVVATASLLPDRVAPGFMTSLHRSLAAGTTMAHAMATARATLDRSAGDELSTYLSVIAVGVGD